MACKQAVREMKSAREDFKLAKALLKSGQPFEEDLYRRLDKISENGWSQCHRNTAGSLLYRYDKVKTNI